MRSGRWLMIEDRVREMRLASGIVDVDDGDEEKGSKEERGCRLYTHWNAIERDLPSLHLEAHHEVAGTKLTVSSPPLLQRAGSPRLDSKKKASYSSYDPYSSQRLDIAQPAM